jgi:hypothetical protein
MSYFIKNGNSFRVTDEANIQLHTELPVGNYIIKTSQSGELFLQMVDNFTCNTKLYGDITKQSNRILSTFLDRNGGTGVMLTGEKGSGKSLLTRVICIEAAAQGIPTIIVNQPMYGDEFNAFIQQIDQPAIILFDEFEKVYANGEQLGLLTLFDGVFPSKKLFLLTTNDKWRVDSHMRNRPGRIFYCMDFAGLVREFIVEYCNDNLVNKTHIEKICNIAGLFTHFNFDMLKALVEEMNRYDEAPEVALQILNIRPEFIESTQYKPVLSYKGIPMDKGIQTAWTGNPFQKPIHIEFAIDFNSQPSMLEHMENADEISQRPPDDQVEWMTEVFTHNEIINSDDQGIKFKNSRGFVLHLRKINNERHRFAG